MVLPIPVGDDLGRRGAYPAAALLAVALLGLFALARYGQGEFSGPLLGLLALVPDAFLGAWRAFLADPGAGLRAPGETFRRLLVPVPGHLFLHVHELQLFGNLAFLWVFGRSLERRMGAVRFLLLFLLGAALALAGHLALHPWSSVPLVGATGGVAALLGGYFATWPHARIRIWVFIVFVIPCEVPVAAFLPVWFLFHLLGTLPTLFALGGSGGHDLLAPCGAFLAGMVLVLLLRGPDPAPAQK